ncbi:MAG: 2-oxo acid dehydrogenase subunit E2 [Oscillospiraceae bacterium]|jgi:pyruvate dehydrogenase E2 component (dihydrolipoamide acetyltransferase)|nr:2-oxo acid dehydrogenase subunit E2 [Oscillospiraceae bacterium]
MSTKKEYTGKKGLDVISRERFGLQRKIVANMTTDSWRNIPHSSGIYEPDATNLLAEFKRLRGLPGWEGISLNSVMLYAMTQGLTACPAMNAHISFKRRTVTGIIEQYADVNISMPMMLPDGAMMTINVHNCERMNLREFQEYIGDVRRRMEKTNMDDALFEVAFDNTMQELKRLRLVKVVLRLLGTKIGAGEIHKLKGAEKKAYKALPGTERLTKEDIEQGTSLFSNVGSVYRGGNYLAPAMLEVIPPQVVAFALSSAVEKPGVVTHADGSKTIEPRTFLPFGFAIDHRALDFGDCMPFLNRMDDIFAHPEQIEAWLKTPTVS